MSVLAVVGSNEYADDLAWDFLKNNWKEYNKKYGEGHVIPLLIKAVLSRYKSLEKIKEVKNFFSKHKVESGERSIQQAIEMIKINYNFVNYNKDLGL